MSKVLYIYAIVVVVVMVVFTSCREDDQPDIIEEVVEECEKSGPPAFTTKPAGTYDGNNFHLTAKTDIPATIYYVISQSDEGPKNADDIKTRALNGSNALAASNYQITCTDLQKGMDVTIESLPLDTKLYAYVIAESYMSDKLLQPEVYSFAFGIASNTDTIITCELPGPPSYTSPVEALTGRSSVDIPIKTDIPAKVYYIVSTNELADKTPQNVKQKVIQQAGFVATSTLEISCDDLDTMHTISVENLNTETKYYVYLVAESYVSDTVLQEEVKELSFTTAAKLSTETFYSSLKGRQALYVRYLPSETAYKYPAQKTDPLIIFLGGNGEVAPVGEIDIIKNGSIPKYLSDGNEIPYIVIAPEHNQDDWNVDFIHEVVEYAKTQYSADPDRVIITGMSGGGIGTWNYALSYPEVPAAIVPVSGESDPTQACKLSHLPVWAMHNDKDPKVPVEGSIDMINALRDCNPAPTKDVKLTVFADEGHNCWIRVFNPDSNTWDYDPSVEPFNIYDWMWQQRRD